MLKKTYTKFIFNLIRPIVNLCLIVLVISFANSSYAKISWGGGWPSAFENIYTNLKSDKNYIVILTRAPSFVIDYTTNQSIHDTMNKLDFQFKNHPGHAMIGWKCQVQGLTISSMVGMNGDTEENNKKMVNEGWGFAGVLATFHDGYIESPQDISGNINKWNQEMISGHIKNSFLMATIIEVTQESCQQMLYELRRLDQAPEQPLTKFGVALDLNKNEGAVCVSFVTHLLSQYNEFKSLIPNFKRNIRVPRHLFGRGSDLSPQIEIPQEIQNISPRKKISRLGLLAAIWTEGDKDDFTFELTDLELLIFWQKRMIAEHLKRQGDLNSLKIFSKKHQRSFWQTTYLPSFETRNDLRFFDENMDRQTAEILIQSRQLIQNYNSQLDQFFNFPAIILEKN